MRNRTKEYLGVLFHVAQEPEEGQHKEDRKLWLDGVAEMKDRERELLEDFGTELARMVLVYPDRIASEMLSSLREHVWLREWRKAKVRKCRPCAAKKEET